MQIFLHIGFPKTGSSAIQAHMMMNRDWLRERGFLFAESGHSDGYGHVHLFEDRTGARFNELQAELKNEEAAGCSKAVLSWEGVAQMGSRRLGEVASNLAGHNITIIAYLREQSEIIQSGYFQAAKQRPQKRVMEDYQQSDKLLTPKHINYAHTLGKFERAFGRDNIRVRIYERDQLLDGDIVRDFLDVLGLQQNRDFIQSPVAQNISLDPGSVFLLNIVDSYFDDPDGREKLVDSLLNDIQCHGAQGKYFLRRERVNFIREHYRAGNESVAREFLGRHSGELFSYARPTYATDQADYPDFCADKVKRLHELVEYRPWDGQALEGPRLQQVASPAAGWAVAEPWGVWSDREDSMIRFRLMRFRTNPFANWLLVRIRGDYFHDNKSTLVSAPGLEEFEVSLEDAQLRIPLDALDMHARVDIRLRHANPVSPLSLGQGDDSRRLAFALKSVDFSVSD
jgi:hypothetical protein